jgi:CheY-like chemotaxis protein
LSHSATAWNPLILQPKDGVFTLIEHPSRARRCGATWPFVTAGPATILVVEHQQAIRHYLVSCLEDLCYHVLSAPDPGTALTVLREHKERVDLVVTDFSMPGTSGQELSRIAEEQRPGIKVLYMSGAPEEMVWTAGFLKQKPAWLAKPFSSQMLAAAVRKALALRRVILVVDSDKEIRAFFRETIERKGYEVVEAASLKLAKDIMNRTRVDLLIGDLARFEEGAGESVRDFRRQHPATAVLALTGKFPAVSKNPPFFRRRGCRVVETDDLKARWLHGADAALPKPVSVDLLLETLKTLFKD